VHVVDGERPVILRVPGKARKAHSDVAPRNLHTSSINYWTLQGIIHTASLASPRNETSRKRYRL